MENHPRVLVSLPYSAPASEVLTAVTKKIRALKAKIALRDTRIAKIRTEHKLKDADLVALLQAENRAHRGHMALTSSVELPSGRGTVRHIPAGVLAELSAESEAKATELAAIEHLTNVRHAMAMSAFGDSRVSVSLQDFVYLELRVRETSPADGG